MLNICRQTLTLRHCVCFTFICLLIFFFLLFEMEWQRMHSFLCQLANFPRDASSCWFLSIACRFRFGRTSAAFLPILNGPKSISQFHSIFIGHCSIILTLRNSHCNFFILFYWSVLPNVDVYLFSLLIWFGAIRGNTRKVLTIVHIILSNPFETKYHGISFRLWQSGVFFLRIEKRKDIDIFCSISTTKYCTLFSFVPRIIENNCSNEVKTN